MPHLLEELIEMDVPAGLGSEPHKSTADSSSYHNGSRYH
jgi:hypothetical protein